MTFQNVALTSLRKLWYSTSKWGLKPYLPQLHNDDSLKQIAAALQFQFINVIICNGYPNQNQIKFIRHTHNIQKQKRTQCIVNEVQRVVPKKQMLRLWATQ